MPNYALIRTHVVMIWMSVLTHGSPVRVQQSEPCVTGFELR